MTQSALHRRHTVAKLSAMVLREKFDVLRDVGVSLASRVKFRELIRAGQWKEAAGILKDIPGDFPDFERIFLADPQGTLMADIPSLPRVVGKNFSHRDWYRGVSKAWEPYISEVYSRFAQPRIPVVAAALPIKDTDGIMGILVIQVSAETLISWLSRIEAGKQGSTYFFDRRGHLLGHFEPHSGLRHPGKESVERLHALLKGPGGVRVGNDPISREDLVWAFEPVGEYGWGVVVQQPVRAAFGHRDRSVLVLAGCSAVIVLLNGILAALILRLLRTQRALDHELKQKYSEMEAFSYSVSHDLRAPLRAIDGFSKILQEDCAPRLDVAGRQALERVSHNARKMSRLIDDLLRFSRAGRQSVSKRPASAGEIAAEAWNELKEESALRQVDVKIDDMPSCSADADLLRQVYVNLLSNALKFTRARDRATIEVGCVKGKGSCVFFVRDNGVGFDMAHANKLFGVFQRLHSPGEFEGTGVGLALVRRIIERHGGRIWAESEINKGATFYFTL